MGEVTKISWAGATFNAWVGCTTISTGNGVKGTSSGGGCDNCYAENMMDTRLGTVKWGPGQPRVRTSASYWQQPLKWDKRAAATGQRLRVFSASLSDVFDNEVDPQWRADLFDLIQRTPNLDWMLLTKRVGNAKKMIPEALGVNADLWPLPNVWLGATVVNQAEADRDLPKLYATPAHLRFLSMEPLLGPVDLALGSCCARPDWVIVGGESGPRARPMDPAWAADLRRQCAEAGVPYFFKQHGGRAEDKGGCLLDGIEIKQWPLAA